MTDLRYRLGMPEPYTHLFQVEIRFTARAGPTALRMPSWTPGSYLIREFPRNVQQFEARSADGRPIGWRKTDKNDWTLDAVAGEVVVRYAVHANELSVRTSHLDASHGCVNGASVFMWVDGRDAEPIRLEVDAPAGWSVTTPLRSREGALAADDYRQLIDSPLEIGTHRVIEFEAAGRPHRYAIWGHGDFDADRLAADTRAIVETQARFWGGLPYDAYTFFLHLLPASRGGLEHRECCSLHADPGAFRGTDYEQFLALVVHEFFHTWNGTRIRPAPLVAPDLTREAYTRNLWVVEGLTSYYTDLLLCRGGQISADRYLERLGDLVQRHLNLPGRHVQTLADSSFDAWIKFYRPDAHTPNAQVSYYQKGALVALLLDMRIRQASGHRRSLDDLMRRLWDGFGRTDTGFPEDIGAGIRAVAEEVAGEPLEEFFARYVLGTDELPLAEALATVGVRLVVTQPGPPRTAAAGDDPAATPTLDGLMRYGLRVEDRAGTAVVTHVRAGSTAHRAGIGARDELVALNGRRTTPAALGGRLEVLLATGEVSATVVRRGELLQLQAGVREDARGARLVRRADPPDHERRAFADWTAAAPATASERSRR